EVTQLLRDSWNLSSVFLFSGIMEGPLNTTHFAVLESKRGFPAHPAHMEWFTIHHALSSLPLGGQERRAVKSSYRKAVSKALENPQQPFCRVGWTRELEDWVWGLLRASGIDLKDFEQLNACETFSLIRFVTTEKPLWFKAVGSPNLHEYEITQALVRTLPGYLPHTLAVKPEWHAWLMSDGGATLDEVQEPSAWQRVLRTLAKLQIESISSIDDLLKSGCRDLRLTELLNLVDPFLGAMADLMMQQTKVPPAILSRQDL